MDPRPSSRAQSHSRAPSRATSISKANGASSTLSRSQSLIRKQTSPVDLRPSDILIERFVAWKAIVKQLVLYFQGLADIQNHTAKELIKLGGVIQLPFRAGNQFLGEGGLQDVFYLMREEGVRAVAEEHAGFGRTIEGSIVRHLEKLRGEIKMHIKNIQNDTGKLATTVSRERELSTSLISTLATSINTYKNTPLALAANPKSDPLIANLDVQRQLRKQVNAENLLQKSIIITQANSATFEQGIVSAIQSAWGTYEEWRVRMQDAISRHQDALGQAFAGLDPTLEWVSFSARTDHLLDPETPLRNPQTIRYPSKDDPSVLSVHEGVLIRKKRYTRRWVESEYVLTPAGFLHELKRKEASEDGETTPVFSLFLPTCTLGPPSSSRGGVHKFHIETTKDGSGSLGKTGSRSTTTQSIRRSLSLGKSKTSGGSGSEHAWTFKCRSREEMMEWWNDIRMLCARYLVASEQIERSGPVEAAVRAAGYDEEEEEDVGEGSEEGETEYESGVDGSSVSESSRDGDDGVVPGGYGYDEGPPVYSHTNGNGEKLGEVGENGYPIDKKSHHSKHHSIDPEHDTNHNIINNNSNNSVSVSRRASGSSSKRSRRQMDKAKAKEEDLEPTVGQLELDELGEEGGVGGGGGGGGIGGGEGGSRFTERI